MSRPEDGLSARERKFAESYIQLLNASESYKIISPRCLDATARIQGSRLLAKPHIKAMVDEALNLLTQHAGMKVLEVLEELKLIAKSDATNYVIDDDGNVSLAKGVHKDALRAISSIEKTTVSRGSGEGKRTEHKVKIRLWDKNKALVDAGRYLGMFVDRSKVELETSTAPSAELEVDKLKLPVEVRKALLEAIEQHQRETKTKSES